KISSAIDFELPDYWDEGEALDGRDRWPVCVSLNLIPPTHFLDATSLEELSSSIRLLLIYSFASPVPHLQPMRMIGSGELSISDLKEKLK
ncbi:hypothetical protein MPER_14016, partial [Moniliophthora perniciosa FA553]